MSNVFTLDAMREEIVNRYAPTVVELGDGVTVELKSMLKMKSSDRKAVKELIESMNKFEYDEEDEESAAEWAGQVIEAASKIFRIAASSPKKLISALEHEDIEIKANLFMSVLTNWIGGSQVGEASSSLSS